MKLYPITKISSCYALWLLFLMGTWLLLQPACITINNQFDTIAPGIWRATLSLVPKEVVLDKEGKPSPEMVNQQFEEVTEGELPFSFEVIYDNEKDFYIEIINGPERFRLDDIQVGRNRATGDDTIRIDIPIYESYIIAKYESGVMQGDWVVTTRENYSIPFQARYGKNYRFTELKKPPIIDLSGKWAVTFGTDTDKPYPAIGEFEQKGNQLLGTFLTETGDYRYLEGTVQTDKMYLSTFDGSHAFLFEAKIGADSTLVGSFRSGKHFQTTWQARRDPNVQLTNPDSLTYLKEGYDAISFSFENPVGKLVSLKDPTYQGKVKIVQIFGTWCPNCRDETIFLTNYLKNNPGIDLEVIALAFEKHKDRAKANHALRTYKNKFNIPYEMVVAGYYNKKEAAAALPMLNHILSYPTMLFVDRNNQVRRIHTGFMGPATSQYKAFTAEFDTFVKQLLAEEAATVSN